MIILKSQREIELIRNSSKLVAEALEIVKEMIKPEITTQDIDEEIQKFLVKTRARAAFRGYKGFPKSICASINDEVVHGIPSPERCLKSGDIISLDFGVYMNGFYGDAAITLPVGEIDPEAQKLLNVTREALYKGIEQLREGNRLSDLSHAIQQHVEKNGFSVVKAFVGHGIGGELHEDPQIPNFGEPGRGPILRKGMVFAIEPMVNMGGSDVKVSSDNWTAVTLDGSLSAHFEHTVAITENGTEILSSLDGN